MSSLLGAIPAIIGVIVGVLSAGWADRVRWERSQAVRWDERRVDAYAEYARAIKKSHVTALAMILPDPANNLAKPINRQAGLELLAQAEAHQTEVWETVLLLADQATAHAALRWLNVVRAEAEFARSHPDSAPSDEWTPVVNSVDEARDQFYEAARKSVNVGGGSVAIAQLLQPAGQKQAGNGVGGQPADL